MDRMSASQVKPNRTPREVFHMPPELHKALRAYCNSVRPPHIKSGVLRAALEDYLRAVGFWPPGSRQEAS